MLSFNLTNGVEPAGLFQVLDGSFYGATAFGGTNGLIYVAGSGDFASGGEGTAFHLTLPPVRPEFKRVALTGSTVRLTWDAEIGALYQVEYEDSIAQVAWQEFGSAIRSTNAEMSVLDFPGGRPQRFYRLVKVRESGDN